MTTTNINPALTRGLFYGVSKMGFYRYVTTIDGIRITGYFSNTDMKLIRAVVGDANIAPLMGAAVVERLEIEAQACRDAAAEIKAWRGLDACHLEEVAA